MCPEFIVPPFWGGDGKRVDFCSIGLFSCYLWAFLWDLFGVQGMMLQIIAWLLDNICLVSTFCANSQIANSAGL